jgi:hypothetical protein
VTTTKVSANQESGSNSAVTGTVSQEVDEAIEAVTNNIMVKGVEIKYRYDGDSTVFVLASLHKKNAANLIASEIKNLEEKLQVFVKSKKRAQFRTALKTYQTRERLNNHYELLNGTRFPKTVSFDQIYQLRQSKNASDQLIFVDISSSDSTHNETSKEVENAVIQSLVSSNFRATTSLDKKADLRVLGKFNAEPQFLNVDGFVKYRFILNLYAETMDGEKRGALSVSHEQVGRDKKQTYDLAIKSMMELLLSEDKLADLELEN